MLLEQTKIQKPKVLFQQASVLWWPVFKSTWILALCSIFLSLIFWFSPVSLFMANALSSVAYVLCLLNVTTWLLMIFVTHQLFTGGNRQLFNIGLLKRLLKSLLLFCLAAAFITLVTNMLFHLASHLMRHALGHFHLEEMVLLVIAVPVIYLGALFVYVPLSPLLIEKPLYHAVLSSLNLVYREWLKAFVVFSLLFLAFVFAAILNIFFIQHHIAVAFLWDVSTVLGVIFFPFLSAFAVLMYRDLSLRRAAFEAYCAKRKSA